MNAEHQADIDFLLLRSSEAGKCTFGGHRWTGMSSNALVRLAYGGEQDCMPSDRSDYHACVLTVKRLPIHRRTPAVMAGLRKARAAYLERYPEDASALDRRRRRQEWEQKRAERAARERKNWERRMRRKHGSASFAQTQKLSTR